MWKPYTEIPWGEEFGDYGYGWGISDMDNERVISWGGGHLGSPNAFYLVPEENLALFVVFNSSPEMAKGNGQVDAFTQQVLHVLLRASTEQMQADQPALDPDLIARSTPTWTR